MGYRRRSGKHKLKVTNYLDAIKTKIKTKPFAVVDIESKGDAPPGSIGWQWAGFTRPFLVGIYDPETDEYDEYRDEPHVRLKPDWTRWHIEPGGCIDKAMTRLLSKRFAGKIIYAHNGGNFDYLFFVTWLREHRDEYGFEIVPVQSSIQCMRVWQIPEDPEEEPKDIWEFQDSVKLLPMSLAKAAESFKVGGKLDQDLNMHEDDPRWSAYLKQDCLALTGVMSSFYSLIETYFNGEVGMTTPSTAMKVWRRNYLGKDGVPAKIARYRHWPSCAGDAVCDGCFHAWIRRGYYGGRTEMFRTKGEAVHYYDINSSYVAAMLEEMPIGDRIVTENPPGIDWSRVDAGWGGFAECTVYVPPDCEIPPLPHRDVMTDKLLFPTGQFHGVWDVEELRLLEDEMVKGHLVKVKRVVWMKKKPMFGKMVERLWVLRDKKLPNYDDGLSLLAKLLGNALYGKFGMRHERQTIVFSDFDVGAEKCFLCAEELPEGSHGGVCRDCEGSKPAQVMNPDSEVWYQAKRVDAQYIIPHVAAHITTLARVRLWRFMKTAIEAGGKIYYLDTDSLLTDVELPSSTELGGFKDEYPGEVLGYRGVQAKCYILTRHKYAIEAELLAKMIRESEDPSAFGDDLDKLRAKIQKVTAKGIAPSERTATNFERLEKRGEVSWRQTEKIRTLAVTQFKRPPQMKRVTKSLKSPYDKRVLMSDGSTRAHVLAEPVGGYPSIQAAKDAKGPRKVKRWTPEEERKLDTEMPEIGEDGEAVEVVEEVEEVPTKEEMIEESWDEEGLAF